jgi:hypothetical protein
MNKKEREKLAEIIRKQQQNCDHSFNDENVCNYCRMPKDGFIDSERRGNPIGKYS